MREGIRLGAEALDRLILGASVLGTGGGGSFSLARAMADRIADAGAAPELVPLAALGDGALGICAVMVGGGLSAGALEAMGLAEGDPLSLAGARAMERHLGRPVDFVYPIEIGPQNTLEAVRLAAALGVPVADADGAGRAVPEMQQTMLSLRGVALAPYAVATAQGDLLLVARSGPDRDEPLCRALARASGGVVSVTGFPLEGARARSVLIPGTLSRCLDIGGRLGEGFDAEGLAGRLGGRVAFRGTVAAFGVEADGGFYRGALELAEGGARYRVGIQNEFLWAWRDGVLDAACPDLVCVLEARTGVGKVAYGNGFARAVRPGEALVVLHLPCDPAWRDPAALRLFPPTPSLEAFPC